MGRLRNPAKAGFVLLALLFLVLPVTGGCLGEEVATPTQTATPTPTTTPLPPSPPVLIPGQPHSIAGFVTDASNDIPISGAQVLIPSVKAEAVTDDFGFYRIDGLVPGTYDVSASATGYSDSTEHVQTETWARLDFPLQSLGPVVALQFLDVFGVVSDRNTVLPIENASVQLRSTNNILNTTIDKSVTTNSEGAYEMLRLPRGQYSFEVAKPDHKPYREDFVLDANQAKDVYLKALPAILEGTVRGNRVGQVVPIEGALIRLVGLDGEDNPIFHPVIGTSDASGHYRLEDLLPLTYTMQVFAPGYKLHEERITIAADTTVQKDVQVDLRAAELQLTLFSSTYDKAPVSGITVQVQGLDNSPSAGIDVTQVSDAQGQVVFTDLVPGTYELTTPLPYLRAGTDSAELYPVRRTVRLGLDEVKQQTSDMPAVPGGLFGWISGGTDIPEVRLAMAKRQIQDGDYDRFAYVPEPLDGATIRVVDSTFGSIPITLPTTQFFSDTQGSYALTLPPGTYDLEVSKDGYVTETETFRVLSFGREGNFILAPTHTTLVGKIEAVVIQDLTNSGQGVFKLEGAKVTLEHDGQTYLATTDERGIFVLERVKLDTKDGVVQSTTFDLTIQHPEYQALIDTVTLDKAEGVHGIVRQLDAPIGLGTLQVTISFEDKDGNIQATDGTLDHLKNLDTQDCYPLVGGVPIPGNITLRARPGTYIVRIEPNVPGSSPSYEYTWTSVAGGVANVGLHLLCQDTLRAVKCSLAPGVPFQVEGSITLAGFVFNRETGEPLKDARVTLNLTVDAEYCLTSCWRSSQTLRGQATTDATGRYEIHLQVPPTLGQGVLVDWSWNGQNSERLYEKDGFESPAPSRGPDATYKGFSDYFNSYLSPTGLLRGLVLSGDAERLPVEGLNDQLGRKLSATYQVAEVRVMPRGLAMDTDVSTSQFEFTTSPGQVTVQIEESRHYPYEHTVLVKEPQAGQPVPSEYTFVLEEIPRPVVDTTSFTVLSQEDDTPLRGYVLKGISANATQARWQVTVDREGQRALRAGFSDPVSSVNLMVEVLEPCSGVPAPLSPIQLQGRRLSGDASGVSIWGGEFDAADLPCGRLQWTVVATTPRTETHQTVQWGLWPAEQRFPLSLLILASYPSSWMPEFLSGKEALKIAPWGLEIVQSALQVEHKDQHLKYKIEEISFSTEVAAPTETKFIRLLGKTVLGIQGIEAKIEDVELDGASGALNFTVTGGLKIAEAKDETTRAIKWLKGTRLSAIKIASSETGVALRYGITAQNVFSLHTPLPSTRTTTGVTFRENVSAEYGTEYKIDIPVPGVPPPVQWVLQKAGIASLQLILGHKWEPSLSWDLGVPVVIDPSLMFQRIIEGNVEAKLKVTLTGGLGLKLLRGITLSGGIRPSGEVVFKDQGALSTLYLDNAKLAGRLWVSADFYGIWSNTHNFPAYTFYEYTYGSESVCRTAEDRPLTEWAVQSWTGPDYAQFVWQPGQGQGLIVSRSYPRAVLDLARADNGEVVLTMVHDEASENWPNSLRLRTTRRAPTSGDWTPPVTLSNAASHSVMDAAVAYDAGGRTLLVWSETGRELSMPEAFLNDVSTAELYYAIYDPSTGDWSTAIPLTADTRPDLAPVLASDGSHRVFLVWAKDMDGNVMTVDDVMLFGSIWDGAGWSQPAPIVLSPGICSDIDLSAAQGRAVLSYVAETGTGMDRAVTVVFYDGNGWGTPHVVADGEAGLQHADVVLINADVAAVGWNEVEASATGGLVEKIKVADVSVSGVVSSAASVATAEDVSDLEALLNDRGLPVFVWSTNRSQGANGIYVSARGSSGWTQPMPILEQNVGFETIEASTEAAENQLFVVYLQRDDQAADIGFVTGNIPTATR